MLSLRSSPRPSVHRLSLTSAVLVALLSTLSVMPLSAQQADVGFSPFVSFLPATGRSPLAGLALTLSGAPGFALRLNGRTALRNTYTGAFGAGSLIPPWGADVDAVMAMNGRPFGHTNRSASTVAFLGVGAAGTDSGGARLIARNWSYGVGTTLPLGTVADFFADSRWRMLRFVLPTASPKPDRVRELRFGLTFHFSGASDQPGIRRR